MSNSIAQTAETTFKQWHEDGVHLSEARNGEPSPVQKALTDLSQEASENGMSEVEQLRTLINVLDNVLTGALHEKLHGATRENGS